MSALSDIQKIYNTACREREAIIDKMIPHAVELLKSPIESAAGKCDKSITVHIDSTIGYVERRAGVKFDNIEEFTKALAQHYQKARFTTHIAKDSRGTHLEIGWGI